MPKRNPATPEETQAIAAWIAAGRPTTQRELAEQLGRSPGWVCRQIQGIASPPAPIPAPTAIRTWRVNPEDGRRLALTTTSVRDALDVLAPALIPLVVSVHLVGGED